MIGQRRRGLRPDVRDGGERTSLGGFERLRVRVGDAPGADQSES